MSSPATQTGRRVMLVDDSSTIRSSAARYLTQAGCEVIMADDGFDALAKISESDPDLIFVDMLMPRLDGLQTCALIKHHPRFREPPVIMLSSRDDIFDRARGRTAGADDYLAKPFSRESLVHAVETPPMERKAA